MYVIKDLKKIYKVGSVEYKALNSVNISFNNKGITTLIGKSGSGKTTLLNILGNLDTPTSGTVFFQGENLNSFNPKQQDAYRNDKIGFIFQHYNLIDHITVYENIRLSLLISNNNEDSHNRIISTLDKVGIKDQAYKLPSELSGGQRQRVSIARAIINKPSVLLCDEPTGALDDNTAMSVMNIIKELSLNTLVILVTHNQEIADKYSDRIIELRDGDIISDTKNIDKSNFEYTGDKYVHTYSSMPISTIVKLSISNLRVKIKRTLMTIIGACIGIFLLSSVSSFNNGINNTLDIMINNDLYKIPVTVSLYSYSDDIELSDKFYHTNYDRMIYNFITDEVYDKIYHDLYEYTNYIHTNTNYHTYLMSKLEENIQVFSTVYYSESLPNDNTRYEEYLNVTSGRLPENKNEILIVLTNEDYTRRTISEFLGESEIQNYIGKEISIATTQDLLQSLDNVTYYTNGYKVEVVGVAEINTTYGESSLVGGVDSPIKIPGFYYTEELLKQMVADSNQTERCISSHNSYNAAISSGDPYNIHRHLNNLTNNGCSYAPTSINIIPNSASSKEYIKNYLDNFSYIEGYNSLAYNDNSDSILYQITQISSLAIIVIALVSTISLLISTVMIAIITYISVIERTKEIGILKSIGANSSNIRLLILFEATLIGLIAGIIGIVLSFLLSIILNYLSPMIVGLDNISIYSIKMSIFFVILSIILSFFAALYPSISATKKNVADILREE